MTDEPVRMRTLVGQNIDRLLAARGWRHEDLSRRVRDAGLGRWDQSTVSRFVGGGRALTFEDAVVIAAALGQPLLELLRGDTDVTLAGAVVPAEQLRDVVALGRIAEAHRDDTVFDELQDTTEVDVGPVAARIAAALDTTVEAVESAAVRRWELPVDDELARRVNASITAFTGVDPREQPGATQAVQAVYGGGPRPVEARRIRAWQAHHIAAMTTELRSELDPAPTRARRRKR